MPKLTRFRVLALAFFLFALGTSHAFAHNKVVVVPLGADISETEDDSYLDNPVTGGNGEGVGASICTVSGIEIFIFNGRHELVDARFSYIVPEFGYGQIRSGGTIRSQSGNLSSVEHPAVGQYCLVFDTTPSQAASEATIVGIHINQ